MPEKIRVLYVDDEPNLLDIGKQFLEQSGDFTVTTATGAPDAIRLLEQEKFDTIISDYQMPEMDGIEFLVEVRTRFGPIPFILFTGKGREEVVIEALNSGADGYLQKGSEPKSQFAELSHKIKQAAARKRAEDSLRKSEEKYRHLIEHSVEAIIVVQDGMPKLVNHQTVEFTGYSEQELLSMSFLVFIHPDDRAMVGERYQNRMKGEDVPSRYAFRLGSKDGSTRWVEISVAAIDWDGRPATLNFLTDITERKRAEEALRESEKKFRAIADYTVNWESWFGPDGKYIWVSPSVAQFTGYSDGEILAMPDFISTVIAKEDHPLFTERFREAIGGIRGKNFEFRYLHRNGTKHWLNASWQPIFDMNGNSLGTRSSGQDITDRKRAEEALAESEGQKIAILNGITTNIAFVDKDLRLLWVNKFAAESVNKLPAEMIGHTCHAMWADPARPCENCPTLKVFETKQSEHTVMHTPDGRVWDERGEPVFDEKGNLIGVVEIAQDITERKRVEEALREGKELLTEMTTQVPGAVYQFYVRTNGELGFYYVSERSEQILGLKPDLEGYFERFTALVIPEHREGFIKSIETSVKELSEWKYEGILQKPTGEKIWFFGSSTPSLRENEIIFNGIVQDITDRKRAEEALRESESFNRELVENLPDYIIVYGPNGKILYVNPATGRALGYNAEELVSTSVLAYIAEEHRDEVISRMKLRHEGREVPAYETVLVAHDGHRRQVIVKGTPIRYHDSPASLILLVDITDRKRAEEELRESEEKFRVHIENSFDVIFTLNSEGIFVFISPAWERHFGYPVSDVIGKFFAPFIHPDDVVPLVEYLKRVLITGQSETSPAYRVKHATGRWLWFVANGTPYISTKGERQFIGVGHDITERKRAEEALRQANKQLNLLSDITRHDITNQLLVLKGYLELSHDVIDKPEALKEYIKKEQQAAITIEHQIMFTKDYQELGVAAPEWQNVNASIEHALFGLPIRDVHVTADPKNPEIFTDRLFEKVFYNLIDNALRYGGDQLKTIRVSSQESDGGLIIVCEDDGVGISAEDKKKLFTRGFGKNTGLGLFLSREILAITGITITETGEPGKGARFEITVPKGMWRMKEVGA